MKTLTDLFWLLFFAFMGIAAFGFAAKTVAQAIVWIKVAMQ